MKIGLIADPHANRYGTEAALERLRDCPVVLCAGDLTGYFPFVNETVDLLRRNRVLCVRGNHDQFLFDPEAPSEPEYAHMAAYTRRVICPANLQFLGSLPRRLELVWDGLRILVVHGSPWNELEEYVYPDRRLFDDFAEVPADVIVLGHTHRPMLRRMGGKLVINPGSCGQPRNDTLDACGAVFDTCTRSVEFFAVPCDMESACEAAWEAGMFVPRRLAALLDGRREVS